MTVLNSPLTPAQLQENFADLHPPLTRDAAVAEAARCQFCYDAPCMRACPTHIDVAKFIRQIHHGDVLGAAETIFTENVLGGSCGRACPTEVLCEGACVDRTLHKAPIQIGRLQRYATDYAAAKGVRFFEAGPDTGKRVAVVGSGPAGLSCAHELRRRGHAVTMFEARGVPGGLNTLGIAAYKISTEFALQEAQQVLDIGIDLRLNSPVDGLVLAELLKEYDAVFLGIGLGATARLGILGEEAQGVWEALDFVFQSHTRPFDECEVGRDVVVIGGGNTAIDCATQARRLGARSVTIAYRRTQKEMSAYQYEFEIAKADGVQFMWNAVPAEFIADNDRLTGVRFLNADSVAGSTDHGVIVPCDMAVKALGQLPLLSFLTSVPGLQHSNGKLVIDPANGWTGISGLFAGGDCVSAGAEIVNAVQDGKIAARGIHSFLSTNTSVSKG